MVHKQHVVVAGRRMAYVERGNGSPVVFLHGNPTSSHLWRGVLPHVESLGRLLAPDLMGMGDSEKLPGTDPERYRFAAHAEFLEAFLAQAVAAEPVTLVLHDWGGALGFDWAYRHPGQVRAVAYMETFVRPLSWPDLPGEFHPTLQALRSEAGEALVLRDNLFIEQALPGLLQRSLSAAEMAEYGRPYTEPGEARRPTLAWPREVPLDGQPAEVAGRVQQYSDWLVSSTVPKLFVNVEPGVFIRGPVREFCRTFPNQQETTVRGGHFVPEDAPAAVGAALRSWLRALPASD